MFCFVKGAATRPRPEYALLRFIKDNKAYLCDPVHFANQCHNQGLTERGLADLTFEGTDLNDLLCVGSIDQYDSMILVNFPDSDGTPL